MSKIENLLIIYRTITGISFLLVLPIGTETFLQLSHPQPWFHNLNISKNVLLLSPNFDLVIHYSLHSFIEQISNLYSSLIHQFVTIFISLTTLIYHLNGQSNISFLPRKPKFSFNNPTLDYLSYLSSIIQA